MPKTLDSFQAMKYNANSDYELLKYYKKAVAKGDVAAVSTFANYKKQRTKIENTIVGKTFNNVTIKSISNHFVDRTVGSIYYTYTQDRKSIKHEGVPVEQTLRILTEGKSRKIIYDIKGRPSQKFILKGVGDVTINPITGELVQVNKDD